MDLLPELKREAKERQQEAGKAYGRGKVPEIIPEANGGESRDQAAAAAINTQAAPWWKQFHNGGAKNPHKMCR